MSELIARLLSHFWTADDHPATRQAQIEDWLEDLAEFPTDAVEEACREWRRQSDNRRPTPGQIRALAIKASIEMNRQAALPPPPPVKGHPSDSFPTVAHRDALRTKFKEGKHNWAVLTIGDKWHYHGYNYGWLRVFFNEDNHSYGLDPDGRWFNADLADRAERLFRNAAPKPLKRYIPPCDDPRFSPEMREHFLAQDIARAALRLQVELHGERDAHGNVTPAMEAFLACCTRQVQANRLEFLERNRTAAQRDSLSQIRGEMGVRAVEC